MDIDLIIFTPISFKFLMYVSSSDPCNCTKLNLIFLIISANSLIFLLTNTPTPLIFKSSVIFWRIIAFSIEIFLRAFWIKNHSKKINIIFFTAN